MKRLSVLCAFWLCGATLFSANIELASLDQRLSEIEASPSEKKFNQIGWAKDIREAIRLGKELNRPIFLFTHDGRINTGRC